MKILPKFVFFFVFVLIFVSCGEKKSVYDEYSDQINDEDNTSTTDHDSSKVNDDQNAPVEDAESGDDDITDTETVFDDDVTPTPDEGIPTDEDNAATDDDAATDNDTEEPMNCTGFSLDPNDELLGDIPSTTYHIKIADNILGDPNHEDIFELRLDHNRFEGDPYVAAGTYDLAYGYNGHNSNNWRCWECVSVTQDHKTDLEKFYFQRSGTLTIESVDEEYNFKGTLSAVLVESTIENLVSSPVENGDCIEIETSFEAKTVCELGCEDVICGQKNACGKVCETGCVSFKQESLISKKH